MDIVVDVHCHMFNASDLPVRGFIKYVALHGDPASGPVADLADQVLASGTVSWADDLARVNTLLGAGANVLQPPEVPSPPPPAPARIDAAATDKLKALHVQHPDLIGRAATALADINAGPSPTAAAGLTDQFEVETMFRAVRWATLFTRSRLELVADYANTFGGAINLALPLMVDLGTSLGDHPKTTIAQQVELFEKISRASMLGVLPGIHGMQIHPFVGFDPLRELHDRKTNSIQTSLDLAKLAVDAYGFVGIKVYPPMGWQPSRNMPRPGLSGADAALLDAIVDDVAIWCSEQDVPLTAHCNDSNYASPSYRGMGAPDQWAALLQTYPGMHLDLGHCGGAHSNANDYSWSNAIIAAMRSYPALFGDTGCDRIDDAATRTAYTAYLKTAAAQAPTIQSRLMFGTDWYMEALNPDASAFLGTATAIVTDAFGAASVPAFLSENALRFLGFDDPNNKNAQRLLARYQRFAPNAVPKWLAH